MIKTRLDWVLSVVLLLLFPLAPRASFSLDVTIDTTPFSGTNASLVFELISGDPVLNAITIDNFSMDGTLGVVNSNGGPVNGSLPGSTELQDTVFLNNILASIALGTNIMFTLGVTDNHSPSLFVDSFSFYVRDASGMSSLFPTDDNQSLDALFSVDLQGVGAGALNVFSSSEASWNVAVIPEPSSLVLLGLGGIVLWLRRHPCE